ncbi:MAG TPA: terminase family protein [Patescibacteria group bacterium]
MNVKLHVGQLEVAKDEHRFRIICAGRRWGKSVLSALIILQWATKNKGLYWIVSPSYRQAKQIHWLQLKRLVPIAWIDKKNEVELSITLKNGSTIELKGAENPDALRGVKLRGLVIDEIASIRNWPWLWQEVLRATLTDYQAPVIFISTPKGYNHFYDLYNAGQTSQSDYKSWRFTSYDNPYIKKEEIDHAKTELTEDTFAQEYLADFRKFTGLVYKGFQRELHVIDPFDIPESWDVYRCMDFGSTNPTTCLWIATDGDYNFFISDEYYTTNRTIDEHAGIINARPLSQRVTQTFGDPSGAQWIKEFEWRKIWITPATKELTQQFNSWVRLGIEKVAEHLKPTPGRSVPIIQPRNMYTSSIEQAMPSLFVFSTCTNTIREFETYRWKEKSVREAQDINEPDVPEKANDHALDALRYFMVSYKKANKYTVPANDLSNQNWSLDMNNSSVDNSVDNWDIGS